MTVGPNTYFRPPEPFRIATTRLHPQSTWACVYPEGLSATASRHFQFVRDYGFELFHGHDAVNRSSVDQEEWCPGDSQLVRRIDVRQNRVVGRILRQARRKCRGVKSKSLG